MSKPTAIHEIIEDPATMTITVGAKVFDRPFLAHIPEWETRIKEQIVDRPMTGDVKALNAFYCAQLGPKFNRRFQAANFYMWIGNRMSRITGNLLRKSGAVGWRLYSPELVYRANQVLPYIKEAEVDGLYHLIPAIVVFQASPSAIRREIGPAAWRRIAHNSRTRNMRIMQTVEKVSVANGVEWKDNFVKLLEVRSGLLGGFMWLDENALDAARLAPRSNARSLLETTHIIRDARRMIGQINPSWGLARIKREHDAAMLESRLKVFSAEDFTQPWVFDADGLQANLLTSPLAINVEGDTQHHCVGSYWRDASRGSYAVLKVDGKERATVGMWHSPDGWSVDQVYAACNAPVTDACRAFAFKAAKQLTADRPTLTPTGA
jgi:hypothetical protein